MSEIHDDLGLFCVFLGVRLYPNKDVVRERSG